MSAISICPMPEAGQRPVQRTGWRLWGGWDQQEVQGKVPPPGGLCVGAGREVIHWHRDSSRPLRCGVGSPLLSSLGVRVARHSRAVGPAVEMSSRCHTQLGSHLLGAPCDLSPSPGASSGTQNLLEMRSKLGLLLGQY